MLMQKAPTVRNTVRKTPTRYNTAPRTARITPAAKPIINETIGSTPNMPATEKPPANPARSPSTAAQKRTILSPSRQIRTPAAASTASTIISFIDSTRLFSPFWKSSILRSISCRRVTISFTFINTPPLSLILFSPESRNRTHSSPNSYVICFLIYFINFSMC